MTFNDIKIKILHSIISINNATNQTAMNKYDKSKKLHHNRKLKNYIMYQI